MCMYIRNVQTALTPTFSHNRISIFVPAINFDFTVTLIKCVD